MTEGNLPQPALSLLNSRVSTDAKVLGFGNMNYLRIVVPNVNNRYGVVYFITTSGVSYFYVLGGAATRVSGTMTSTYDSDTGTYEFDTGSRYQHGVIIIGSALAQYGVCTLHN